MISLEKKKFSLNIDLVLWVSLQFSSFIGVDSLCFANTAITVHLHCDQGE